MKSCTVVILLAALPLIAAGEDNAPDTGPLRLTMKRAVDLALSPEGNTRVQVSNEVVKQAQARSGQARAALLPNVDSYAGLQNAVRSLTSQGLDQVQLPFNITIPQRVGPFNLIDIRASMSQNVLDLASIRRFQMARAGVRVAKDDTVNTQDQVAGQVAKAYLAALRGDAELEVAQANVNLAEALQRQAEHLKATGTGTGIEITRAKVQLSYEKQRLLVARNNRQKAHLQLLRALNLRLDTELELTDKLTYKPTEAEPVSKAKTEALETRADLKTQLQREETARLNHSAVKWERLPSLVGYMDYGTTGQYIQYVLPTRTLSIGVRVPVFDGGRRDARRAESASQYRQEQLRTRDMKEQIELELRTALDSLHSAEEQVKVAQEGVALSENELTQARRRYDAGVSNSLEVTDAQTRLERAQDNQIAALFNYNVARIDLAQARGNIRSVVQ
jgi:outer membrane protein